MKTIALLLSAALGACILDAPRAHAAPARCEAVLRRESAKFARFTRQAIERCEAAVVDGTLPATTDCRTDFGTTVAITAAAGRARVRIDAACCGADRVCGTGDDDTPASIGWTSPACPNLENDTCTNAVADADDVAGCVTCAGSAAGERLDELLHERFAPSTPGSSLAACQAGIARASATFFVRQSKVLRACWEARARGAHANDCPVPGDGRAASAIAHAEQVMTRSICRACGGADGACGGGDDLAPATLGFVATCPALTPPGGASCAGPVTTLTELAACTACLSRFAGGCIDRLAVPEFTAYPAECNPARGTCSAGVECVTSLDCPTGYTCRDNGGGTRFCVGSTCALDAECGGGGVCRPYCTAAGCGPKQCQCPAFSCPDADEVCLASGSGHACNKLCTQDSDCTGAFDFVCVNSGFGAGLCVGTIPCQ